MTVPVLSRFNPSSFVRLPASEGAQPSRIDAKVAAIAVSNEFSGQLTVTTAEGDKVTLTADFEERVRALAYRGHAEQDGTAADVRAQQVDYSLSRTLGLTVEGDLNDEEVEDLTQLFKKVLNIFRKFIGGHDEEALAKTAKLADRFGRLPSLSGLDVSVDVERSVTVVAAQVATHITAQSSPAEPVTLSAAEQPATPGAAPQTAAVIPQPSTDSQAPTQPAATGGEAAAQTAVHITAPVEEQNKPTSLVQQVLDAVRESDVEGRKLRKYLPRLLNRVREELEQEREHPNKVEPKQTPQTPAPSTSAFVLAYQSFSQTSLTLSIRS